MANRTVVLVSMTTLFVAPIAAGCGSSSAPEASRQSAPTSASTASAPAASPPSPTSVAAPKVPGDQQDALAGVDKYLRQTLDALPKGTTLDGTRYVDGPGAVPCDDAMFRVQDPRDVDAPPGTDVIRLVTTTGDLWRQWGWNVDDADEEGRPSREGNAPDGYVVRITAAQDPKQRASLIGSSPCFPASLRENDIPRTPVLEQSP